jgi:hypothetical protein
MKEKRYETYSFSYLWLNPNVTKNHSLLYLSSSSGLSLEKNSLLVEISSKEAADEPRFAAQRIYLTYFGFIQKYAIKLFL